MTIFRPSRQPKYLVAISCPSWFFLIFITAVACAAQEPDFSHQTVTTVHRVNFRHQTTRPVGGFL